MTAAPRMSWLESVVPALVVLAGGVLSLGIVGPISALDLALPLLWAGAWLVVLTLATFGLGELVFPLGGNRSSLEQLTLALAAGAGGLIAVAGLLGALHLLHGSLLLTVLAAAACRGGLRATRLRWHRPAPIPTPALASLTVVVGGISLLAATAPSPFYDQWNYHLAMPFHWLAEHRLVFFPRQVYTLLPANGSLLFSYALAGPGPWAAQVTTWWCTAVSAMAAACLARSMAPGRAAAPWIAAAVLVCTPSIAEMATLALADPVVMMFGAAAWITVRRMVSGDAPWSPRTAAVTGAFIGLAVGSKYLAGLTVAVPIAVALVVAAGTALRRGTPLHRVVVALAAGALASTAVFLPWALRNTAVTGSPLYPYFAPRHPENAARADGVSRLGFEIGHLRAAASLGAVGTEGHAARVGPLFLWMAPLTLLDFARRRTSKEGLLLTMLGAGALAGVAGWTLAPPYARFLAPVLVVLAALGASAWAVQLGDSNRGIRVLSSAALLLVLIGGLNPGRMSYVVPQLQVASGIASSEGLLSRDVSSWSAMRAANRLLPPDATVLLVAETRSYGFQNRVVVEDPFGVPLLVELAERSSSPHEVLEGLRRLGITHVLVNWREAERLIGHPDGRRFLRCRDARSQAVLDGAMSALLPLWHEGEAQILSLPVPPLFPSSPGR